MSTATPRLHQTTPPSPTPTSDAHSSSTEPRDPILPLPPCRRHSHRHHRHHHRHTPHCLTRISTAWPLSVCLTGAVCLYLFHSCRYRSTGGAHSLRLLCRSHHLHTHLLLRYRIAVFIASPRPTTHAPKPTLKPTLKLCRQAHDQALPPSPSFNLAVL